MDNKRKILIIIGVAIAVFLIIWLLSYLYSKHVHNSLPAPENDPDILLHYGSGMDGDTESRPYVARLQSALNRIIGLPSVADGKWGSNTQEAVRQFNAAYPNYMDTMSNTTDGLTTVSFSVNYNQLKAIESLARTI